ncbi:carbohydrate-binding protein [Hymenobacter arizonensis]|uniref:Por secretion system C-terminal sorting domain-containing protein n=1 Tax=Hymenobacter arizonensis TaxID=1227077 RepID=A0A1I5XXW3_HYMAR|nr:family 16 glycosylhydrolase [Hymenobacter arizonensis]SFQ36812.1 Por secretion system C-terminal sorting domain-containing protein [Hymenobacter arizonensis]
MKTLTSLLGAAALLFSTAATQAQTYQQVWADEFTTGIGPSWTFETGGGGWGNNEKQYYQAANATVVNGELQITARKQAMGGMPYTSARMITKGKKEFTYGRMEARIKLPLGQGLWPAFWMLGSNISTVSWPRCGEIDIMEQVNADSRTYGTVHWDNNGHAEYGGNTPTAPNVYHVYAIEWEPAAIRWYVDGVKFHEINISNGTGGTEEFQKPFFLLLNLAVAGNWPGQTVDESKLPATMFVDYVRVYQKTTSPTPTPTALTLQAEAANVNNGMVVENCTDTGGGQNMGYIDAGDYLVFNNVNFATSGTYLLEYRVASGAAGGTISSDLNAGSTQLGTTAVPGTGGWQNWTTVSRTVTVAAGSYNFGVFAQTGGYNLNWVRITKQGTARTALATTKEVASTNEGLTLYPNPVTDRLTLATAPEFVGSEVQILSVEGRQVWRGTYRGETVDVSALKPGLYTLILQTTVGQKQASRFSKQ